MAGITLEQAQAQLDAWLAASTATATNQSYSIEVEGNRRQLTRADAGLCLKMINYWQGWVVQLSNAASGASRSRTVVN